MNHNYKIADFQCIDVKDVTDLKEAVVSVALNNKSQLPECLVHRMEHLINRIISDYEEKIGLVIPLEDMELEMYIEADTVRGELFLNAYISYSFTEEFITGRENVMHNTEEYRIIKNYFMLEMLVLVFRCALKIFDDV